MPINAYFLEIFPSLCLATSGASGFVRNAADRFLTRICNSEELLPCEWM